MLLALPAEAHSWYARTNCCNGTDCAPVPLDSGWVTIVPHGYQVTLTLEQAKLVNPNAKFAINVFIPEKNTRVKVPPILKPGETYGPHMYHLCIPANYVGVHCLFVVGGV
jgi:hypothetical protein